MEYCETVEEARAAGWLNPYVGGRSADGWKGRIYGKRPGNHRIFRCTKPPQKAEDSKLTKRAFQVIDALEQEPHLGMTQNPALWKAYSALVLELRGKPMKKWWNQKGL